jgi:hypothetical protein
MGARYICMLPLLALTLSPSGCASKNATPTTTCPPVCGTGGMSSTGTGGTVQPGAGGVPTGAGGATGSGGSLLGQGGSQPGAGGLASGKGGALPTGSGGASAGGVGAGGTVPAGGAAGMAAGGGMGGDVGPSGACGTVAPTDDYAAAGPFAGPTMMDGSGPDGMYTIIKPATLGQNGFKHPIATWGNGITTTPSQYRALLTGIASHGFVIIASDSSNVTAALMTQGLDWLIKQNDSGGMFADQLNVNCAASIGYSLGGGAAVTAGNHKNVMVTVSMHGLTGMAAGLHGPLLLFTSVMDTFVGHAMFVDPNYKASPVQTFYATLVGAGDNGHLTPIGSAGPERAPMIAWLRLWIYGDQGAKKYFYGDDCILCKTPWGPPQDTTLTYRKNWK